MALSCHRCRKRKQRCDHNRPMCGGCIKAGVECGYAEKMGKRGARPGKAMQLEARLFQIEQLIQRQSLPDQMLLERGTKRSFGGEEVVKSASHDSMREPATPMVLTLVTSLGETTLGVSQVIGLIDAICTDDHHIIHPVHLGELRASVLDGTVSPPLLDAFISLAIPFLSSNPQDLQLADAHHDRATTFVGSGVDGGVDQARTAMLLLCSPKRITSMALWMYLGTISRVCLNAGLYRMDAETNGSTKDVHYGPPEVTRSPMATESSRRLWWSNHVNDVIYGIVSSRPPSVDDRDFEIRLPGDEGPWITGIPQPTEPPMYDPDALEYEHLQDPDGLAYEAAPTHLPIPSHLLPLFPKSLEDHPSPVHVAGLHSDTTTPGDSSFRDYARLSVIVGRINVYVLRSRMHSRIRNPSSPLSEFATLSLALRRWTHSLPASHFPGAPMRRTYRWVYTLGLLHLATITLHRTRLQSSQSAPLLASTSAELQSLRVVRHSAHALTYLLPRPGHLYETWGIFHFTGPRSPLYPSPLVALMAYTAASVHADTLVSSASPGMDEVSEARSAYIICRKVLYSTVGASDTSHFYAEVLAGSEARRPSLPPIDQSDIPTQHIPITIDARMAGYLNEAYGQDMWAVGQCSFFNAIVDMGNLEHMLELPDRVV